MNKNDLIREIAKNSFLNQAESRLIVNKIIETIANSLKEGKDVNISGLGKFYLYKHSSRPVRNPKTNQPMVLPEFKSIKFKPNSRINNLIKEITRVSDE
jgi:DNA-binding protein HU-beta